MFHLKIENLELFVNYFFRYVKILRFTTLTNFSVLPFLPLLHLLECRYGKSVHCWPQLHNKVSTWFLLLHRIKWACELLLLLYHCFAKNILILGCKPHSSAKMNKTKKKQHHASSGCWEVFYKKSFPKNYAKCTEKVCLSVFLILLKASMLPGLQLY